MTTNQDNPTLDALDRFIAAELARIDGMIEEPSVAEKKALFEAALNTRTAKASSKRNWLGYGVVAAAVCVLAYMSVPAVSRFFNGKTDTLTYKTLKSQRASITLADGSSVILAPATTLRVNGRSVELEGEAVFTVESSSDAPFTVKTGNTVTRVLGTTFGVRSYATDKSVRVTVAVGRVSVASAVLSAGEVASLTVNATEPAITSGADIASALAWTSDRLVFNNTPLPKVIEDLERWYNIRFTLGDATLASSTVTTSLSTQSLDEVIRVLSVILNANAERTVSGVTFHTRQ